MNELNVRFNEIRAGFGMLGRANEISLDGFRLLSESEASVLIDRIQDWMVKIELRSMRGKHDWETPPQTMAHCFCVTFDFMNLSIGFWFLLTASNFPFCSSNILTTIHRIFPFPFRSLNPFRLPFSTIRTAPAAAGLCVELRQSNLISAHLSLNISMHLNFLSVTRHPCSADV